MLRQLLRVSTNGNKRVAEAGLQRFRPSRGVAVSIFASRECRQLLLGRTRAVLSGPISVKLAP